MKAWFEIDLWKRVIGGLVLGVIVGLSARYAIGPEQASALIEAYVYPVGQAFIRLIRMLIVPLIFVTLVSGVTAMGDPSRLGSIGGKTLALYIGTTAVAVTLGLLVGSVAFQFVTLSAADFTPSADDIIAIESRLGTAQASGTLVQRLLAIIPDNPVQALAEADILAVIFFAIVFGVGCIMAGEAGRPIARAIESASDVMLKVTVIVMEFAPFGVFALMSWVMASKGLGVLQSLGILAIALYLVCFMQIIVVYGGILKFLGYPLGVFFRGITDAQAVAFSTASSAATLPVTLTCAQTNLGIKKPVAASVLPLGATINMDGVAIYL
ncbi:MAG: dicarboxylate/amino acid:cation symporter, partial [Pseudomonadota bacterium]